MPTVRTTMQPHLELDVSDTEYTDLKRQGLLVEEPESAAAPAAAPAKSPAAAKSKE
ncbi:hypothetical protein OG864_45430 [Streptomyces sp. NBC_00124]|uniref:hypothetical protein n=1 Tax=Streptomyces sp. NBC_00124 TaxID=2975662 RepID=UPI00224E8E86|nr:hypothetical protein [Streptomyces sp. NBC_00124]MCX5365946.1 hypothetical protein [Streptomyces sp. NBC_00124]